MTGFCDLGKVFDASFCKDDAEVQHDMDRSCQPRHTTHALHDDFCVILIWINFLHSFCPCPGPEQGLAIRAAEDAEACQRREVFL